MRILLDPRMQQKLCSWLCPWMAFAVLGGALCFGNPFLGGPAVALSGAPEREGDPSPSATGKAPLAAAAAPAPAPVQAMPASFAVSGGRPPLAMPAMAIGGKGVGSHLASDRAWPKCPDEALDELVIAFDDSGSEPVWLLRDGRKVTRSALQKRSD
jgi:hypothetical protein